MGEIDDSRAWFIIIAQAGVFSQSIQHSVEAQLLINIH